MPWGECPPAQPALPLLSQKPCWVEGPGVTNLYFLPPFSGETGVALRYPLHHRTTWRVALRCTTVPHGGWPINLGSASLSALLSRGTDRHLTVSGLCFLSQKSKKLLKQAPVALGTLIEGLWDSLGGHLSTSSQRLKV